MHSALNNLFAHTQKAFSDLPSQASRLFHGRGHCYENLHFINIDWFAPAVWVVLYGQVEDDIVDVIAQELAAQAAQVEAIEVVMIQRRVAGKAQQDIVYGSLAERYFALEDGMRYQLNLAANQNIGFFLDAQPGRQWVKEQANNQHVLNLFAYTCSFSVAALQGKAASVVNIDMAKGALATGQKNHALNDLDSRKARFMPHDIFRSTKKLLQQGPYDLVVIDPPTRQKGSFEAEKDYGKLLRKLKPMLSQQAQILACLNAPHLDENYLPNLFAEHLPEFTLQHRLPQRADFPEADLNCCLKMQVFRQYADG